MQAQAINIGYYFIHKDSAILELAESFVEKEFLGKGGDNFFEYEEDEFLNYADDDDDDEFLNYYPNESIPSEFDNEDEDSISFIQRVNVISREITFSNPVNCTHQVEVTVDIYDESSNKARLLVQVSVDVWRADIEVLEYKTRVIW